MAAFSRLQLAAALIEYDNDSEDESTPRREANQSAIFSHLRRRNLGPRTKTISGLSTQRKSSVDYLSVPLPSDAGSIRGGDASNARLSQVSISSLQNPFHADVEDDDLEPLNEDPEVDLSSWGLDSILPPKPKEKGKKKARRQSESLKDLHAQSESSTATLLLARKSLVADEHGFSRRGVANSMPGGQRRHSVAWDHHSGLNDADGHLPAGSDSRPITMFGLNSAEPLYSQDNGSRTSTDLYRLPDNPGDPASPTPENPFSPPLPAGSRLSRFDPKVVAHARTVSGSNGMPSPEAGVDFASRRSIAGGSIRVEGAGISPLFPPSPRSRSPSNASHRSALLSEAQLGGEFEGPLDEPRNHRFSRADLMRPKILVMPSPLQSTEPEAVEPPQLTRTGFEVSSDGPPLPPGAKTSTRPGIRPLSSLPSTLPVASNSFTPNPRLSMTLSQLTFRNTLLVGGQRDVAYVDIEGQVKRAETDGEQVTEGIEEPREEETLEKEPVRPAGKLFGRSLIDELESRKARLRSKQRVFMGDQRPSMMDRTRSSTLISPQEIGQPIASQEESPGLSRRNSRGKPLITLEEPLPATTKPGAIRSTSVFGVDTLWEREVARLKEIEALEAEEELKQQQARAEEESRKQDKNKRKGNEGQISTDNNITSSQTTREPAPTLPDVKLASAPRQAPAASDSESDDSDRESFQLPAPRTRGAGWFAGSSDDGKAEEPSKAKPDTSPDSDDDIPLSHRLDVVKKQMAHLDPDQDSSDEDKPLSSVLQKITSHSLPPIASPAKGREGREGSGSTDEDEDDTPLALRRATIHANTGDDEDDTPLGLRKSFSPQDPNLFQQQQFLMQAQLRNTFAFPPPSVVGGFSQMGPMFHPAMVPPQHFGPPPFADPGNFGRVDAWRRAVG